MVIIWYVMFCPLKNEEEVIRYCRKHLMPAVVDDVFLFTYDCMKRYQGSWHTEVHPMFPGCVFLESRDGSGLNKKLAFRIHPEEETLLKALCGRSHHVGMSRGYIRDGITYVTEGPLTGREQLIRRIDRHKRLARLKVNLSHKLIEINVGLEIVEKN